MSSTQHSKTRRRERQSSSRFGRPSLTWNWTPNPPSINTHEFTALTGANGEKVFEAYAQNNTPGAYRIFWHYGPDESKRKKRTPVITIVAITRHP